MILGFKALTTGLSMIPFWIKLSTLAAAVAVVGGLVWQFDARGNKIVELEAAAKVYKANQTILEETIAIRDQTMVELAKRIRGQDTELENLCKIMKEIEDEDANDPNTDSVGTVLDGLQRSNTVNKADKPINP